MGQATYHQHAVAGCMFFFLFLAFEFDRSIRHGVISSPCDAPVCSRVVARSRSHVETEFLLVIPFEQSEEPCSAGEKMTKLSPRENATSLSANRSGSFNCNNRKHFNLRASTCLCRQAIVAVAVKGVSWRIFFGPKTCGGKEKSRSDES